MFQGPSSLNVAGRPGRCRPEVASRPGPGRRGPPAGRPDPDNFSHRLSALCERAGLGHWHPHELRHSGASLMLAQGTPLHVVSEVPGHTSIAITKDVYGHLMAGDRRSEAISGSQRGFHSRLKPAPDGYEKAPDLAISAGRGLLPAVRARRDSNP
ncbi:tyrosine-type recombinase/integrase [Micromonospora sp. PPF5-17]|nr:tyrosine-type recombinase/integrase [Micromonospora sp. PPF5-17B]NES39159.1 tyrosine-type recombinase/integrase [Micromonospora solifontis]NES58913.1 tyrosine-type recombinase/integrase [Micromonospora sp. PPF5-6]